VARESKESEAPNGRALTSVPAGPVNVHVNALLLVNESKYNRTAAARVNV
jgi:hypothetical protein